MGNIGSGSGSSYPGTLDTQTAVEVDSPAGGKTKARAAVPNDLAACVLAVETALGTNPQGSKADVKTFLQIEHNTDGTHKTLSANTTGNATTATTATTATNIAMNGETSATSATSPATIDMGTVKSGDRMLVSVVGDIDAVASSLCYVRASKSSGTATIVFANNLPQIETWMVNNHTTNGISHAYATVTGVVEVTGDGTLVLQGVWNTWLASPTLNSIQIYAFFLKKQ